MYIVVNFNNQLNYYKMRKILLLFILTFLFVSCNQKNAEEVSYATTDLEEEMSQIAQQSTNESSESKETIEAKKINKKKIIKDGKLGIRVSELEITKLRIDSLIKKYGGYYANESFNNSDWESSFTLKIRIPSVSFENFISDIEQGNGEILYKEIDARDVTDQFIDLETIKKFVNLDKYTSYNKNAKEATFLNILLGIYCKSGIQPWILAKNLSSECYIGIDVCRENNMSTAGLIQVVGKDGRVLKCKTISVNQNGEKIDTDLLKSIVSQAKELYKSTYNKDLKHIVFHRDGISREDLEKLKEITQSLEIDFEYIEVTKNINRRMAMLEKSQENYNSKDKENKKWITEIGMCFEKENEAYLITTNPSGAMGMARPLRIKKVYGHQSMQNIIEDVYKLSFMHIGSIMKSRLPITTHYADLSSIYSHRDFMPKEIDTNILHFI